MQLKRFAMGGFGGGKLNHHVQFEPTLNLKGYMSGQQYSPHTYSLCGVIVHAGSTLHSGHYFSYVKAPNGIWHCMDDASVRAVCCAVLFLLRDSGQCYCRTRDQFLR